MGHFVCLRNSLILLHTTNIKFERKVNCIGIFLVVMKKKYGYSSNTYFFFFNWDSLHAWLNSHYEAWSDKKESTKKIIQYRKSVQKEPTVKTCLLILDLKPLKSQVKGIPEFSCAGKETVDTDTFVTSRNGDRKLMQSI